MSTSEPLSVTAEPTADGLRIAQPPAEAGSGATAVGPDRYAPQSRTPAVLRHPMARMLLAYVLLFLLLGSLSGLAWNHLVDLPAYRVSTDGTMGAATTERGLANFFGSDGWFCILGAVLGLMAGLFGWRWFRQLGWLVVVLVVGTSAAAAGACWGIGSLLGPRHFDQRLAAAAPGSLVPIDFDLRSWSAVLVWPLFAVLPVVLFSVFSRDPESAPDRPRALRRRPRKAQLAATGERSGAREVTARPEA